MAAAAVEVRNGYKYYGSKSNPKVILHNLNMHVSAGSIYGLLGASGCGKTTLLSCIVGQRKLNGGEVSVLGMRPGDLPGSRIGYMPQEIALVEEMTVKETVFYFGRIYGLTDEKIREKFKLLRDLLQLPPARQLVKNCSGGQQRRVSFACAMIHDPELLILDEPTVGLDPMLREKIWDFLVESTRNAKRAVIITTHYIEEAKKAHCIGLMRNGILLAEDTPLNILQKFECNSIEDAFLVLCRRQGDTDVVQEQENSAAIVANQHNQNPTTQQQQPHLPAVLHSDMLSVDTSTPTTAKFVVDENDNTKACVIDEEGGSSNYSENRKKIWFTTKGRLKALMTKNFVQLFRQPSGIIFMLLFPLIQLSCFYLAIGKTPNSLKIGIVSNEVDSYDVCFDENLRTAWSYNETECIVAKLSCRYITELGDSIAERIYFNSTEDALSAAKRTEIIGFIHFPQNFSSSLKARVEKGRYVEDDEVESSQFDVHIDMTDQQIAYFIERKLRDVFTTFQQKVLTDCNLPDAMGRLPVKFEEPIYGSFDIEFQQYVAPGVVMTMVFFLATLMTAAVFISERMDGVWDRTLVAGVSAFEMLWAHLLTQIIIMAFQSFEVIMYIGLVFDTYNKGDTCTLIGLLTMTAFCGMLFGLLISVYCKSHTEANFVATGAFYPMIILCGLLWPLEGMPKFLQDVVMFFPFTIPSMAARNVIEKGWTISNGQVYNGFLVMAAWILIFFTLCIVGLRRKA